MLGVAPARDLPQLAPQNLRNWFHQSHTRRGKGVKVLLWPDTFNNYFYPGTGIAAVEVLELMGYEVILPPKVLCCGRPLYDYGLLAEAKDFLRKTLNVLEPYLQKGIPVVGLEPSCISVFRDELLQFFPEDALAQKLAKNSFLFPEFLNKFAGQFSFPASRLQTLVQGHCHHKTLGKMGDEEAVLKRANIGCTVLDAGCCGMAGAFGFEEKHYEVSKQIGERVLLPAVRGAAPETLIVADGFSCREQIRQLGGKRVYHLAEVLHRALHP
jgi:Fe-S oxidoreductase